MEQWAANTLRTIGIIIIACTVLVVTLFLLLMSMCAYQGGGFDGGSKRPEEGFAYLVGAILVVIVGVVITTLLARGIVRSSPTVAEVTPALEGRPQPAEASATLAVPLHFSPSTQRSIHDLILAIAAQIVVSAAAWAWTQFRFLALYRVHNLQLPPWAVLTPFLLNQLPYGLLIYGLVKKVDRRMLTFAIAVPAVLSIWTFILIPAGIAAYRNPGLSLVFFAPGILHIVILALAWRVVQRIGIYPPPSSFLAAGLASFIYFFVVQVLTTFLYKFAWRFHG